MAQRKGPRLEGRNGEIWQAYLSGWTQTRIAESHNLSQQHVSDIIREVRESIPEEDLADVRTTIVERLDTLIAEAHDVLRSHHYVVSNAGKIVYDENGQPLRDDGPRLAAAKAIVGFDAERRKLLGLDSPTKLEHSGGVKYEITGLDD